MKKIILILITILTSTIITSQMRFNYIIFDHVDKDHSSGVIYEFDNENEVLRYIPVNRIKVKKDEVVYLGKWENRFYKMTYNKIYGDFIIKERALRYKNKYTLYFHRDYDYYDQLTGE